MASLTHLVAGAVGAHFRDAHARPMGYGAYR